MSKSRFQLPPTSVKSPAPPADPDSPEARRFIEGGDTPAPAIAKPPPATSRTWDQDDEVRGGPGCVFNLRVTHREAACLALIGKKTPLSKHQFVISALRPALAAKVKELTGEDVDLAVPEDDMV